MADVLEVLTQEGDAIVESASCRITNWAERIYHHVEPAAWVVSSGATYDEASSDSPSADAVRASATNRWMPSPDERRESGGPERLCPLGYARVHEQPSIGAGMTRDDAPDLITRRSSFSHDQTLQRLTAAITAHQATLFDVIDHTENAAKAGLELPPTCVVIFGDPVVGTPLMLAAPSLALDLPSRVLIRSDPTGAVEVVYRDPAALAREHGLADDSVAGLSGLIHIIDEALAPD